MSVMIVGPENTSKARLLVLRSALKLELVGMKARRGFSAYQTIKDEFNLKGNKRKVYDQFDLIVKQMTGV